MQIRPGIDFANLTDVGCQRKRNEDFSGYWEAASDESFQRKGRLAVVADGMGGYEGGEQASRIAVDTVCEVYEQAESDPQTALADAFQTAHQRIQTYASKNSGFQGMGTTCTAACLADDLLYFAHVGDSRLYLVRDRVISRLTRDHSYVGRLVETGLIREEDAETHPQRHILTAALGVGPGVTPDAPPQPLPMLEGDTLVLCTDGLWGLVNDHELHEAVTMGAPALACAELVKLAKQRGGPDNITVQVMRIARNGTRG
jgi:PPM family protein phosphatase